MEKQEQYYYDIYAERVCICMIDGGLDELDARIEAVNEVFAEMNSDGCSVTERINLFRKIKIKAKNECVLESF